MEGLWLPEVELTLIHPDVIVHVECDYLKRSSTTVCLLCSVALARQPRLPPRRELDHITGVSGPDFMWALVAASPLSQVFTTPPRCFPHYFCAYFKIFDKNLAWCSFSILNCSVKGDNSTILRIHYPPHGSIHSKPEAEDGTKAHGGREKLPESRSVWRLPHLRSSKASPAKAIHSLSYTVTRACSPRGL